MARPPPPLAASDDSSSRSGLALSVIVSVPISVPSWLAVIVNVSAGSGKASLTVLM